MRVRVLHLLSQKPGWTGSGVALDAIVRCARKRGWEQVVVVGTAAGEPHPEVGGLEATKIRSLVFGEPPLSFALPGMSDVMPYPSTRFSAMDRDQLEIYRRAWREHIAQVVEDFRPAVIHSHHLWLMSSLLADSAPGIPAVTHCHGTGLRQLDLCPHLAPEVCRGCARNNAFLALHGRQAAELRQRLDISAQQLRVVGSGFRHDLFHDRERRPAETPTIAYVGKLSNAKGLPWLLDAVDRVRIRVPAVTLHVAGSGSGDEATSIRQRLETLPWVVYHGQLDQQQLACLLRRSHLLALPSFFEGLPLVLVEAAACGCRLVATDLPGVVDDLQAILGEGLQTVPLPRLQNSDEPLASDLPRFVADLADAIDSSLREPPLEAAPRQVADMTWSAVFRRIEAVWTSLIQDGPAATSESSSRPRV